jgi:hypothetical protein
MKCRGFTCEDRKPIEWVKTSNIACTYEALHM